MILTKKPIEQTDEEYLKKIGANSVFEGKVIELLETIAENTKK